MCTPSVRGKRLHQHGPNPRPQISLGKGTICLVVCVHFRFNTFFSIRSLPSPFSLSLCHTLPRSSPMTITTDTRKPYSGNKRSLVLAFDVGTTFSGVSYAILEPNEIPKIHGVTRCVQSLPSFTPLISLSSASLARNMSLEATKYLLSCTTTRKATSRQVAPRLRAVP